MSTPLTMPLADAVFISEFAAYARKRGDEGYNFLDASGCAIAQCGNAGLAPPRHLCEVLPDGQYDLDVSTPLSKALCAEPWTFSALADRLDALLADAPVVQVQS